MDREIKFRVWDKVINKMITKENVRELLDKEGCEYCYYGDEWYPAYTILGVFDYFEDVLKEPVNRFENSENRFELMQFTGLYDKNKVPIYERRYSKKRNTFKKFIV